MMIQLKEVSLFCTCFHTSDVSALTASSSIGLQFALSQVLNYCCSSSLLEKFTLNASKKHIVIKLPGSVLVLL